MEEFSITDDKGNFLKISFQEVYGFPESTGFWGGYDVQASIEIKSGCFTVKSTLLTSTGEIHEFYKSLEKCYNELKGFARFANYEDNLEFIVRFDDLGHINIKGKFYEFNEFANELKFEFSSDQTFMLSTFEGLKQIELKYGDMKGIKK